MTAARKLTPDEFRISIPRLGEILADAVNSGAGVSFMLPFTEEDGASYWKDQQDAVNCGRKIVFASFDGKGMTGTVTLDRAWQPNQRHRGEIAKMLVHSAHRRRGIGKLLLEELESEARALGLTLLTFDTVRGSAAESFYRNLGFNCIGYIPAYALSPTGRLDDTALFYKQI